MLDRIFGPLAERWPWFRTALSTQKRFSEVHGGMLTSSVTLSAFLSLFPLILFLIGVLGFFSVRTGDLPERIIGELGLTGDAAMAVTSAIETAEDSRRTASIIGLLGLLWSGLGFVDNVQLAFDTTWQVRGQGLKDRLRGLAWLGGAVVIGLTSFGLTALLNVFPGFLPLTLVAGLAVNTTLWLWTHVVFTRRRYEWKDLVPGAVLGGIGFEVLKAIGSVYVPRAVAASSGLYGSIGTVFAVIAWLFFFGRLLVYTISLNVVRHEEEHGTVSVQLQVPRRPDEVPLEATRAGEVALG